MREEGEFLEEQAFVPHAAVSVALLLALLSIGVLVYFIHHVSDALQVWTLAQRTSDDLLAAANHTFPDGDRGQTGQCRTSAELPTTDGVAVRADCCGYVTAVRDSQLMAAATRHYAVMMLRVRPGDFCVQGTTLVTVWSGTAAHDVLEGTVRSAVTPGAGAYDRSRRDVRGTATRRNGGTSAVSVNQRSVHLSERAGPGPGRSVCPGVPTSAHTGPPRRSLGPTGAQSGCSADRACGVMPCSIRWPAQR